MDLVSIEAPAARVTRPRKPPEFLNTLFGIGASSRLNRLIEALAQCFRPPADTPNQLPNDGSESHTTKYSR
jgi:hypothetical protein